MPISIFISQTARPFTHSNPVTRTLFFNLRRRSSLSPFESLGWLTNLTQPISLPIKKQRFWRTPIYFATRKGLRLNVNPEIQILNHQLWVDQERHPAPQQPLIRSPDIPSDFPAILLSTIFRVSWILSTGGFDLVPAYPFAGTWSSPSTSFSTSISLSQSDTLTQHGPTTSTKCYAQVCSRCSVEVAVGDLPARLAGVHPRLDWPSLSNAVDANGSQLGFTKLFKVCYGASTVHWAQRVGRPLFAATY